MTISKYCISKLVTFILNVPTSRNGEELVQFFNVYGIKDVYDIINSKLPKLYEGQTFNTSRRQYANDRLEKLNNSEDLRRLIEDMLNSVSMESLDDLTTLLKEENYDVLLQNEKYHVIGGVINNPIPISNSVKFQNIQQDILTALDKARVSINVAVAWFTNQTLADKLIEKFNKDVRVEVIINNDGVNTKNSVNLGDIPVHRVRSQSSGLMHDKFCIIDNQIVLNGSYNWTNNAEFKNEENCQTANNPELATEYSVKFRELLKLEKLD